MISVILYGRNDSYGYNLHKRAALSLNCIAEILDAADDEILFVDYNTPDDLPTFPEAIRDTLTPRAAALLRILRIRPAIHARVRGDSRLMALEPIARNAAIRRSNPANRWILSTNTDMIFVPEAGRSLSATAAGLATGYAALPRFELPESLWETLDRRDPAGTIAQVRAWGRALHLDTIVEAATPDIAFDDPGDFQLIRRDDLFAIHGFDERMLLGWHVDANMCARLGRLHGAPADLSAALRGYHCDHTRQVTPAHRPGAQQNDWQTFYAGITRPEATHQADSWGLPDAAIEEVPLQPAYPAALAAVIAAPQDAAARIHYGPPSYNRIAPRAEQVLPFLLDSLSCYAPATRLGWFAGDASLLDGLARAWPLLGFTTPILLAEGAPGLATPPAHTQRAAAAEIAARADIFGFDFTDPTDAAAAGFTHAGFQAMTYAEAQRLRAGGGPPRRFIAVNSVHSDAEQLVSRRIGAAMAPIATWIRQGFVPVPQPGGPRDLLAGLLPGAAGARGADGAIDVVAGRPGHIFYGPYIDLPAGRYRVEITLTPQHRRALQPPAGLLLEVVADATTLARSRRLLGGFGARRFTLDFAVPPGAAPWQGARGVEIRASGTRALAGRFTRVVLLARDG